MTTTPEVTRRHRALIVEDDPAIRRLVGKLLQRRGIDIDVANDGKQAIEKIRTGDYSVLILDLMVPEVNGFEIIDFVRKNQIRTPVAVVSAVSAQALTKLDTGIVKIVISKPFDVDEFTSKIVALCCSQEASSSQ
jgi:two-component system response regulator VicR